MSRLALAVSSARRAPRICLASDLNARRASATFWKAVITVARYCASACSSAASAAFCLWYSVRPSKIGAVAAAPQVKNAGPGGKILRQLKGGRPAIGGQRDIGQTGRDSDADLGCRRMHIGFGCAHVRPLIDQLARQADRQIGRQLQMRQ